MKKILVVIDMQNDFIDGAIGTKQAVDIVPNVVQKIKEYNPSDVYYTMDTHSTNYMQTNEGKYLPIMHCIEGTDGINLSPSIADLTVDKNVFSKNTFGSVDLATTLKNIVGSDKDVEIEIIGLVTDICVVTNAILIKSFLPEVTVTVDSNCCAGVTPYKHECALEVMRSNQIVVK